MNLTSDAILYYADNPVDFVEDIIRAKPDSNQRAILNSVAKYPMTSVRSGHARDGVCSRVLGVLRVSPSAGSSAAPGAARTRGAR